MRWTLIVMMLAAACGPKKGAETPPPPAVPDAGPPLASREQCDQALTKLVTLQGEDPAGVTPEQRAQWIDDCAAVTSVTVIECVLRAENLDILQSCGGPK